MIAFFELPEPAECPGVDYFRANLVLALDRLQDPGNLWYHYAHLRLDGRAHHTCLA